jgi:hypothetical protein
MVNIIMKKYLLKIDLIMMINYVGLIGKLKRLNYKVYQLDILLLNLLIINKYLMKIFNYIIFILIINYKILNYNIKIIYYHIMYMDFII